MVPMPLSLSSVMWSGPVAQRQNAAVDDRMERLHPAAEHLREAGEIGDLLGLKPSLLQASMRVAGAD